MLSVPHATFAADNRQNNYGFIEVKWDGPARSGWFRVNDTNRVELKDCSATTGYAFNVISRDNTICGQAFGTGLKHMDWPLVCPATKKEYLIDGSLKFLELNILEKNQEHLTNWARIECY